MPGVSQTVLINVVIKGTGGAAEVAEIEAPLRKVHQIAIAAARAINGNLVPALQRAAAAAAQLNISLISISKLIGVSTLKTDTTLLKSLRTSNAALTEKIRKMKELQNVQNRVTSSTHNASGAFNFLGRIFNTLTKAITSMIGVMLFWTALITIPTMMVKGFIELVKWAIRSADAIQQVQLSLAALIASTHDFGSSVAGNFKASLDWAQRIHIEFIRLSADSLATAEELELGYQAFLAGGGQAMVRNLEEEIQLTTKLGAAILTLTGRQQASRQMFTEMRAAMEGTALPGAQLVRFIKSQVGDYNAWIAKIKESKNGLEEFSRVLAPFEEAGKAQAVTITGLATSIKGFAEALNLAAMQGNALSKIQGFLKGIRDALGNAIRDLTTFDTKTGKIKDETQHVLDAFAKIGSIVELTVMQLTDFVTQTTNARTESEKVLAIAEGIAQIFVYVLGGGKAIFEAIHGWWLGIKGAILFIKQMIHEVDNLANHVLAAFLPFEWVLGMMAETHKAAEDNAKAFDETWKAAKEFEEAGKGMLFENWDKYIADFQTKLDSLSKDVSENIKKAFQTAGGESPLASAIPENLTDAQLRGLQRLRSELELLKAHDDEILQIQIKQAQKANEIEQTYQNVPNARAEALEINKQITEELIKQNNLNIQRNVLDAMSSEISAARNSFNEFAAAGDALYTKLIQLNIQMGTNTDMYDKAVVKAKQLTFETLQATLNNKINSLNLQLIADTEGELEVIERRRRENIAAITNLTGLDEDQRKILIALMNIQLDIEKNIYKTRLDSKALLSLKESVSAVKAVREEYISLQATYQDVANSTDALAKSIKNAEIYLKGLQIQLENAPEESGRYEKLLSRIRALEEALRRAKIEFKDLNDPVSKLADQFERAKQAIVDFANEGGSNLALLGNVGLAALSKLAEGWASIETSMFEALFAGESVGEALLKGLGRLLIQIGEMLVSIALASMLLVSQPWTAWMANLGSAIKLLALGTAMIAAGAALGAGGGKSTGAGKSGGETAGPSGSSVRQQDVLTQQGIYDAINMNTAAISALNDELGRLSKESGDVLVSNVVKKNPNTVLKPLTNKVRRSYSAQKSLNTALYTG